MGKRLIIQRREEEELPAHRVASHRFKDKIRYRSYDALEKKVVLKESLLMLAMTQQELLNCRSEI